MIHASLLLLAPAIFSGGGPEHILPVTLVELPPQEKSVAQNKVKAPVKITKPKAPTPLNSTEPVEQPAIAKSSTAEYREAVPATVPEAFKNYPPPSPIDSDNLPRATPPTADGSGGGASVGVLFGDGPRSGVPTTLGRSGAPTSGAGRGAAAPGVSSSAPILKTHREAKPIETVRANYPPMALRAGLESDVTLRIEIDSEGKVTKAEIVKSGGAGFDEEALKAVKKSRFEPAQRNGQNVAGEFTFIYRFRLQR